MDTVSKKKRSEIMSRIKDRDSKIETLFRKEFSKYGLRYRKNSSKYFGKPDLILKKYKTVIFIDSCFWHGCKRHCRMPSSKKAYWINKISNNRLRDKKVNQYYKKLGWISIRIWEHQLQGNSDKILKAIVAKIKR